MQYAALGAQRPPSRHKEPPQNLGLDLPYDNDGLCVDEDYDSGDAFEIGLDKANKSKNMMFQDEDSEDSFNRREDSSGNNINDNNMNDMIMNDFLN